MLFVRLHLFVFFRCHPLHTLAITYDSVYTQSPNNQVQALLLRVVCAEAVRQEQEVLRVQRGDVGNVQRCTGTHSTRAFCKDALRRRRRLLACRFSYGFLSRFLSAIPLDLTGAAVT